MRQLDADDRQILSELRVLVQVMESGNFKFKNHADKLLVLRDLMFIKKRMEGSAK